MTTSAQKGKAGGKAEGQSWEAELQANPVNQLGGGPKLSVLLLKGK